MSDVNQNQPEQQDAGKIQKQYDEAMKKMAAILGGKEDPLAKGKVSTTVLGGVVDNLLKERHEEIAKTIKDGLSQLLNKKIAFDKEYKEKERALKQLAIDKQKEVIKEVNRLVAMVENFFSMMKDYENILSGATGKEEDVDKSVNLKVDNDDHV